MPLGPEQLVIAASMPGGAGTLEERVDVMERASRNSLALPRLEAWHQVGAAGEPAFEGSWGNAPGVNFPAAFYKDAGDIVRIRGCVRWTGAPPGIVVFHLPAGYRPTQAMVFPVYCEYTGIGGTNPPPIMYCVVDTDGTVSPNIRVDYSTLGMTSWRVFLDPIQFRTT